MSGSITIPINLNDCNRSTIRTNSPSGEEDSGKSCGPGRPSHWGMSPFIYCCPLRAWGHAVSRSSPALLHSWSVWSAVSLRLILQRLGTCYHWRSIIRRPVSDQLIQQNLHFLPITTCISVIPPTLPSLWCSDTWMPCATLHCHWGSSWRAVRYQWASLSVLFSRLCSNSSPAQVSFRWGQYLAWTGNAATSLECKTRSPGVRNSHLHPALPLTNCLPIQMFRVCIMREKWQIK